MRIKRDIMEEIEEIERIKERRRRWVIVREMKEYIDEEGREIRDIEKERWEIEKGEGIDIDKVIEEEEEIIKGEDEWRL